MQVATSSKTWKRQTRRSGSYKNLKWPPPTNSSSKLMLEKSIFISSICASPVIQPRHLPKLDTHTVWVAPTTVGCWFNSAYESHDKFFWWKFPVRQNMECPFGKRLVDEKWDTATAFLIPAEYNFLPIQPVYKLYIIQVVYLFIFNMFNMFIKFNVL